MPNQRPPALREQIVFEYRHGRSIRALAKNHEPCEATIRDWVEAESGTRFDESEADKLKRLRKENKQLRTDKLILEKAEAWFAPSISSCRRNRLLRSSRSRRCVGCFASTSAPTMPGDNASP